MQFYKSGFRGGNPDIKEAAPGRRNRGIHESLPEKVDVLISGTGPAGLCLAAQLAQFPEIPTMIVERMPSNIIKGKADGINTRVELAAVTARLRKCCAYAAIVVRSTVSRIQ